MTFRKILLMVLLGSSHLAMAADQMPSVLNGWQMQDAVKVEAAGDTVSTQAYKPQGWYRATVPGTVLTTLVDNKVYPEPLFGENMRSIPESLSKTSYWYRTEFPAPALKQNRHLWLHFGGINYAAEIWLNGHAVGTMRGAFRRGDFDVTDFLGGSPRATLAVLVKPQPHPGVPHEHTQAAGLGSNGGETAIDGPTFLSTIGWDWLPAIRDRDTGIWLPVTLGFTGPLTLRTPVVRADLSVSHDSADLTVGATVTNLTDRTQAGMLVGTITGRETLGSSTSGTGTSATAPGAGMSFRLPVRLLPKATLNISLDPSSAPELHLRFPALWWPNGYGPQNLYQLSLRLETAGAVSDATESSFGVREIEYQIAGSDNLALSVNGVPVMVRGGNWGLDEAMKRIPRERLEAQFRLHALANLNLIRNWVGQSTSPDFYDLADKYGLLLWDEFFQPNPNDGPDVTDYETYLANVTDKVLRFRNHPSIAIWCARNEGFPPRELDQRLRTLMATLDPTRLYQSSSTDGRGVSSHGPYFWRAPAYFYSFGESFKTEVGSVSIPTMESIQGMMPRNDWETMNDDWAQHDFAHGAQRGDEYPHVLDRRFGPVRNLADFVRKGQMANYEAFRAMYEGRNAGMFKTTTGIITWMSHPAQPSFVWQLYHYDLEPNASLFAVKSAAEPVHIQLNQATGKIEVINNRPEPLRGVRARVSVFNIESHVASRHEVTVNEVPASSATALWKPEIPARISPVYFVKLDLLDAAGALLSTNLYWQNVEDDDFTLLDSLRQISLDMSASSRTVSAETILTVELHNSTTTIALMTHLQLRRKQSGLRVLPAFYSDNYVSLAPGETRTLTITAATADFHGEEPLLVVDGYNLAQEKVAGAVEIGPNENADPKHWPVSSLVRQQ